MAAKRPASAEPERNVPNKRIHRRNGKKQSEQHEVDSTSYAHPASSIKNKRPASADLEHTTPRKRARKANNKGSKNNKQDEKDSCSHAQLAASVEAERPASADIEVRLAATKNSTSVDIKHSAPRKRDRKVNVDDKVSEKQKVPTSVIHPTSSVAAKSPAAADVEHTAPRKKPSKIDDKDKAMNSATKPIPSSTATARPASADVEQSAQRKRTHKADDNDSRQEAENSFVKFLPASSTGTKRSASVGTERAASQKTTSTINDKNDVRGTNDTTSRSLLKSSAVTRPSTTAEVEQSTTKITASKPKEKENMHGTDKPTSRSRPSFSTATNPPTLTEVESRPSHSTNHKSDKNGSGQRAEVSPSNSFPTSSTTTSAESRPQSQTQTGQTTRSGCSRTSSDKSFKFTDRFFMEFAETIAEVFPFKKFAKAQRCDIGDVANVMCGTIIGPLSDPDFKWYENQNMTIAEYGTHMFNAWKEYYKRKISTSLTKECQTLKECLALPPNPTPLYPYIPEEDRVEQAEPIRKLASNSNRKPPQQQGSRPSRKTRAEAAANLPAPSTRVTRSMARLALEQASEANLGSSSAQPTMEAQGMLSVAQEPQPTPQLKKMSDTRVGKEMQKKTSTAKGKQATKMDKSSDEKVTHAEEVSHSVNIIGQPRKDRPKIGKQTLQQPENVNDTKQTSAKENLNYHENEAFWQPERVELKKRTIQLEKPALEEPGAIEGPYSRRSEAWMGKISAAPAPSIVDSEDDCEDDAQVEELIMFAAKHSPKIQCQKFRKPEWQKSPFPFKKSSQKEFGSMESHYSHKSEAWMGKISAAPASPPAYSKYDDEDELEIEELIISAANNSPKLQQQHDLFESDKSIFPRKKIPPREESPYRRSEAWMGKISAAPPSPFTDSEYNDEDDPQFGVSIMPATNNVPKPQTQQSQTKQTLEMQHFLQTQQSFHALQSYHSLPPRQYYHSTPTQQSPRTEHYDLPEQTQSPQQTQQSPRIQRAELFEQLLSSQDTQQTQRTPRSELFEQTQSSQQTRQTQHTNSSQQMQHVQQSANTQPKGKQKLPPRRPCTPNIRVDRVQVYQDEFGNYMPLEPENEIDDIDLTFGRR